MRLARGALALIEVGVAALTLSACGPHLPKGVDPERLDQAVSAAIGGPNTCMLIGRKGSGAVVWRYNTHMTCARALPACDTPRAQTVDDLLKATAKDGRPRTLSCDSAPDGSRGVGWSAGPVPRREGLVYAAAMEGDRALPGLIMAEKLEGAFEDAGF
jgi:hypothetical protein